MTKIFKNMAPYWYMIVAIVLLLVVQAFGDLSLPQYTSDIIDVGIQNKGVEHILPVKMTEDEYEILGGETLQDGDYEPTFEFVIQPATNEEATINADMNFSFEITSSAY